MRKGTKSILLKKLATFTSELLIPVDVQIVDGNEALYHTPWPKFGTFGHFADTFCNSFTGPNEIYVIFDKYMPGSIKSHERMRRAGGLVPKHHTLSKDTPISVRDIIMKSDHNKEQLIKLICDTNHGCPTLHLIGKDQSRFNHEEADVNIVSYLLLLYEQKNHIQVVADDTDIFVLLVYFVWKFKIATQISMKKHDGQIININDTVKKLGDKCQALLPLHAITGCDSVSYPFGKGKVTAVNLLLKKDLQLTALCDSNANEDDILKAGTHFLVQLYGGDKESDLSTLRYHIFSKNKDPPKIKSLPPTNIAAARHIKRAYIQTLIWDAADQMNAPDVDLSHFGFKFDVNNIPVPDYGCTSVAPPDLLKVVACTCKSANPCATNKCSCRAAGLSCTSYCKCDVDNNCLNENTVSTAPIEEDSDVE